MTATDPAWSRAEDGWKCPRCHKRFIKPGLSHSCAIIALDDHFLGRPRSRQLFDALTATIETAGGPFRLSIAKTRIGLINGITFAAIMPRKNHLRFHFLLKRRLDSNRVVKLEYYDPWYVHVLELHAESELNDELRIWLREAWLLGVR